MTIQSYKAQKKVTYGCFSLLLPLQHPHDHVIKIQMFYNGAEDIDVLPNGLAFISSVSSHEPARRRRRGRREAG
uniref:Uncharacterized protein n=1 Tax=Pseudonaja textilis TaxID=8673 RepID=A0A670Z6F5_PSETE